MRHNAGSGISIRIRKSWRLFGATTVVICASERLRFAAESIISWFSALVIDSVVKLCSVSGRGITLSISDWSDGSLNEIVIESASTLFSVGCCILWRVGAVILPWTYRISFICSL